MRNDAAIEVYRQTIARLESVANVLADSTHMTMAVQAQLTVDDVGNDHLNTAHDHLREAIARYKEQLETAETENELEPEYSE